MNKNTLFGIFTKNVWRLMLLVRDLTMYVYTAGIFTFK